MAVTHSYVRAQRTDEVEDETDRGGRAEHRQGEAQEQAGRAGRQAQAERDHPLVRHLHSVGNELDRLGADEIQRGGVAVRERSQERDRDVRDVHTSYDTRGDGNLTCAAGTAMTATHEPSVALPREAVFSPVTNG